jgi:uncharacterized protein
MNLLLINRLMMVGLLCTGLAAQAQSTAQNLKTIALQVGKYTIKAQLASTPEQRTTGLMYRKNMPTNEGMLFVFPQPDTQCFWMKNTLLPLSAAFILDDGEIVNIENMKPQTLSPHCSKKPVRYVLEMNQGWFEKNHLQAGAHLKGLPAFP